MLFEDMSEGFRRKLRTEMKVTSEQPIKHQEHVVELAKRVLESGHENTLVKLTLDPRYAADGRKQSILFEAEKVVPKIEGDNVEDTITLLKSNSIDDAIDFGVLDRITGVVGRAYTRTGRVIPIIVKKWEFAPGLKIAKDLLGLGTLYITPGNRRSLHARTGKLTGIQVVGRGLTPDDYLMNMVRMYLDQKKILGQRRPPVAATDLQPKNVGKVVGWFDVSAWVCKDPVQNARKIVDTAIEKTKKLIEIQQTQLRGQRLRGSSVNARDFINYVESVGEKQLQLERGMEWFESMARSPQFWRWATARFKHILPRRRAQELRKMVLRGDFSERPYLLRLAEKKANAELIKMLI